MTRCRTAKFHNVLVETVEESPLDQVIREQLDRYFQDLDGRQPVPLHPLLHEAVDRALYRLSLIHI